jgi:hypothetical protein
VERHSYTASDIEREIPINGDEVGRVLDDDALDGGPIIAG